jgi:hypothetical protein
MKMHLWMKVEIRLSVTGLVGRVAAFASDVPDAADAVEYHLQYRK